ncbi:hypothetical protein SCARR_01164 [Pontiella sulfatireligans]|uniref:Uncharacterized protein n=1 Tax=Pontiella sulfatireligans TaxID=2750658 RepID=A0A6C2UG63_9BACT|nr:hypothetical protein SCARR_01164 [Pontiella sulfatireligans]
MKFETSFSYVENKQAPTSDGAIISDGFSLLKDPTTICIKQGVQIGDGLSGVPKQPPADCWKNRSEMAKLHMDADPVSRMG